MTDSKITTTKDENALKNIGESHLDQPVEHVELTPVEVVADVSHNADASLADLTQRLNSMMTRSVSETSQETRGVVEGLITEASNRGQVARNELNEGIQQVSSGGPVTAEMHAYVDAVNASSTSSEDTPIQQATSVIDTTRFNKVDYPPIAVDNSSETRTERRTRKEAGHDQLQARPSDQSPTIIDTTAVGDLDRQIQEREAVVDAVADMIAQENADVAQGERQNVVLKTKLETDQKLDAKLQADASTEGMPDAPTPVAAAEASPSVEIGADQNDPKAKKDDGFDKNLKAIGIDMQQPDVSAQEIGKELPGTMLEKATRDFLNAEQDKKLEPKQEAPAPVKNAPEKTIVAGGLEDSRRIFKLLRKIPFMSGVVDRMEIQSESGRVDKLNSELAETEARIERRIAEMTRVGMPREQADATPEIMQLKQRAGQLNAEVGAQTQRRDAIAEMMSIRLKEQMGGPKERVRQIEEGVANFRAQIDQYNQHIDDVKKQRAMLGPDVSPAADRSFNATIVKANNAIRGLRNKLGKLVIEGNKLGLSIKELEVASGSFDDMKNTAPRPTMFDYGGMGGRLAREHETGTGGSIEGKPSSVENNAEGGMEAEPDLETYIAKWNDIAGRYNSMLRRGGQSLLPKIGGSSAEYNTAFDAIKDKVGDATMDAMSPDAFKLFIQSFAEKKGIKLDMTKDGQGNLLDALKEMMRVLDIEPDAKFFDIDQKEADKADTEKSKKRKNKKTGDNTDVDAKPEPYAVKN